MSNSAGSPKLSASQRIFSPKRGLDAELIGADWSFQEMKENLALGKIDATQGLDVKFTAGLHKGSQRMYPCDDGQE